MDPQGSWSCSAPSRWSCAKRRGYGEVSSCTFFRKPGSFFTVSKQGPCFTAVEEDGGDKSLLSLNVLPKLMLHCQILFSLAIAATAEAILTQTSLPSFKSVTPRYLKLITSSNFWPFLLKSAVVVRAIGYDLTLFCADFHSISCCSVYESVGEVLKLTIAAARKVDVFGKS